MREWKAPGGWYKAVPMATTTAIAVPSRAYHTSLLLSSSSSDGNTTFPNSTGENHSSPCCLEKKCRGHSSNDSTYGKKDPYKLFGLEPLLKRGCSDANGNDANGSDDSFEGDSFFPEDSSYWYLSSLYDEFEEAIQSSRGSLQPLFTDSDVEETEDGAKTQDSALPSPPLDDNNNSPKPECDDDDDLVFSELDWKREMDPLYQGEEVLRQEADRFYGTDDGGFDPVFDRDPTRTPTQLFPIRHPEIFIMVEKAFASSWSWADPNLGPDTLMWRTSRVPPKLKRILLITLGFFAGSEVEIVKNLLNRMVSQVKMMEANLFFAVQLQQECVHTIMYNFMVNTIPLSDAEKNIVHSATKNCPIIKFKNEWARRLFEYKGPRAKGMAILGLISVELIFFSSSFAYFHWCKAVGILPGMSVANDYISSDEASHGETGLRLFSLLKPRNKPTPSQIICVLKNAAEIEKIYVDVCQGAAIDGGGGGGSNSTVISGSGRGESWAFPSIDFHGSESMFNLLRKYEPANTLLKERGRLSNSTSSLNTRPSSPSSRQGNSPKQLAHNSKPSNSGGGASLEDLTAQNMKRHVESIANAVAKRLNVPPIYPDAKNSPFSWMEISALSTKSNQFEVTTAQYCDANSDVSEIASRGVRQADHLNSSMISIVDESRISIRMEAKKKKKSLVVIPPTYSGPII